MGKKKRDKYLHIKTHIQYILFTAFHGWLVYLIHGWINFKDESLYLIN